MAYNPNPLYKATHISGAGTFVTSQPGGVLHTLNINTAGTTVTLSDGSLELAAWTTGTGCYQFDCAIGTNITVVTTGTPDITITFL